MKDIVTKIQFVLTFERPMQLDFIRERFTFLQQQHENESPGWSTGATRITLISQYWLNYAMYHCIMVLLIAFSVCLIIKGGFQSAYLIGMLIAGFLSFFILCIFFYLPGFITTFLPRLETAKAVYEQGQVELIQKCRKEQYSNLALCLIFYVFDQTNRLNSLQPNDQSAKRLTKLFGIDHGSIKSNLELLLRGAHSRKNLTDRKRTEIQNRFAEAADFFTALNFSEGLKTLEEMEASFFEVSTSPIPFHLTNLKS